MFSERTKVCNVHLSRLQIFVDSFSDYMIMNRLKRKLTFGAQTKLVVSWALSFHLFVVARSAWMRVVGHGEHSVVGSVWLHFMPTT